MGWQIPAQIEQDIISGKAQYRTFQTGVGGQSILPVPNNAYAVIFGYDFSPAGGGFRSTRQLLLDIQLSDVTTRFFETQQISFYTGTDFYPFIHHVNTHVAPYTREALGASFENYTIDNTPISRQVYITSSKDITISVGLVLTSDVQSANNIPITNRTPELLTYGGAVQAVPTETDFGPAGSPVEFIQPSPKDFQDFGFGVLPNGASGQAFATPDLTNGLLDPNLFLSTLGVTFQNAAAANYFLCLHYALYTSTIPEQRG